ncbi:hypothetical protein [Paenibacillus sacheonensis]|uniref:Uncharacterized protein n=1 Tax=Paenibacillus sacheonensis TaxID=742054 RepID=A0A7X5C076_9BACL|nr:hypothetical protein [Paenibacillus sacheonensis]MBM7563308.1 hypothetical protein [Paenibacillus sacheonensis]NBC68134.1 hypothetical protein [Paenibacillus sacheonensis]
MNNDLSGQPVNSQQLSYEQFQEQVKLRQEQEQLKAKEALKGAGLDPKSQHLQSIAQALYSVESELKLAENQIQMQMDAQRRQIQLVQQKIHQAMAQVQGSLPNAGSGQSITQNYMQ